MAVSRSLIAPTSNPLLERTLLEKLSRRAEAAGSLGKLEPLAVRLGLMQNTLKPRFRDPQLVVFAADHGMAVDGIDAGAKHPPRHRTRRYPRRGFPCGATPAATIVPHAVFGVVGIIRMAGPIAVLDV